MPSARAEITALARLADEAGVKTLDDLIDALADQWKIAVDAQHERYLSNARYGQAKAEAWLSINLDLLERDEKQLERAEEVLRIAEGRRAIKRATRNYRTARAAHALSRRRVAAADYINRGYIIKIDTARRITENELGAMVARGKQLKQLARLQIAARLRDEPATNMPPPSEPTGVTRLGSDRPADQ
jgi:hypothetical protein